LRGITRARLGPLEADGPLARARVRAFGRSVPIESPPLSYGERHAAALAIRMGAADFLAVNGIVPPLLVDEPFAYLDPEHAAYAWEVLLRIAEDRQVIVATQDRLVLEHLGVEPAVVLGGGAGAAVAPGTARVQASTRIPASAPASASKPLRPDQHRAAGRPGQPG